tara:strand:- start:66 stop:1646 length:1581 start_codon:yes stop_codon:yes gene_type:complete
MKPEPKFCAVYTRKSSEYGLEQKFNSLDAQREAGEAFVKSQAGEGWKLVADRYDDGGYSGGSMERPALKRLLADIALGKIDVVVVYKIDRLTRSLADFARMVETFDSHEMSFVSVTQSFNTTSSMGRLTLNVLLSFAQFKREVTGERIRDKIAASKAKGLWMGGTLPLGYDKPSGTNRLLKVNECEARVVKQIFKTYLEVRSVHALERVLNERGIISKLRVTNKGKTLGGQPFSRGALFYLLRNQTYRGMLNHKNKVHVGLHEAIVDAELFDNVQKLLNSNSRRHGGRSGRVAKAPFTGLLFDSEGSPMSPSFSHGARGQVYRYYVSTSLLKGGKKSGKLGLRVAATAVEQLVEQSLLRLMPQAKYLPQIIPSRIEVHDASLVLYLPAKFLQSIRKRLVDDERAEIHQADPKYLKLTLAIQMQRHRGKFTISSPGLPITRPDPILIKALRAAHSIIEKDRHGFPVLNAAPTQSYKRLLVRLAFLAPDIQEDILVGRQPAEFTLERFIHSKIPSCWEAQRQQYGWVN